MGSVLTPDQRIARAARWAAFYAEKGGLAEMIDAMRATHLEALTKVEPWDTDRLKKIGLSMALVSQLEQTIRGIMTDGRIEEHAVAHRERIEQVPERKRKLW